MKRFVITLLILIVLSIAVFVAGLVTLRLEPGKYGVMVSKTGGVDPVVMRSGDFRWDIAALLPTNLKILSFTLADIEQVIELGGTLPSAEIYQDFMADGPDFTWAVSVELRASVLPESLPQLVEDSRIFDDAGLSDWLDTTSRHAVSGLQATLINLVGTSEGAAQLMSGAAEEQLKASIEAAFPELSVINLSVRSVKAPDLALYESARALYLAYIEKYRGSVEPELIQANSTAAAEQVRIEVLRSYGELLERFPDLIDYLAIEAGIPPRQRAVVQTFLPPFTATAMPTYSAPASPGAAAPQQAPTQTSTPSTEQAPNPAPATAPAATDKPELQATGKL